MPNESRRPMRRGHGGPPGANPGEKPQNFKKSMMSLLSYCKAYMPGIAAAVVLAVAGTIFSLIGPNKLQDMTEIITEGLMSEIDLEGIKKIGFLLVVLYILSFVFHYIQGFIMTTITQKVTKRMRSEISRKINKVPLNYYNKTSLGDVLSRVTNDVDMIGQTMNQSIGMLVTAITMFLGSLIMMFITNVLMAVTGILSTIIGFALMMLIMSKSQKHFIKQQNELGRINGHIEEIYSGQSVVKVYNGVDKARDEFENINDRLYESAWKSQFMSGLMMPIMNFIGNFGYVAVCIVGALIAINTESSSFIGVIVAFMIYIRLFTNPLAQIAQAATSLQTTAAASERVFKFLDEKELEDESEKTEVLRNVNGNVEFKNVKFGYDENKIIINNFSA
ncbi:MAG: ABC transporter ATP-binding protein, partial [Oscillospiraceae bacterium]|nr:ABC transporter ATP-binding protein [Oscillospiraceae bacterium]